MEKLRFWLAKLLYHLACRLARQDFGAEWAQDTELTFAMLQARRMERAAREWHAKYRELRRKEAARRAPAVVQF